MADEETPAEKSTWVAPPALVPTSSDYERMAQIATQALKNTHNQCSRCGAFHREPEECMAYKARWFEREER